MTNVQRTKASAHSNRSRKNVAPAAWSAAVPCRFDRDCRLTSARRKTPLRLDASESGRGLPQSKNLAVRVASLGVHQRPRLHHGGPAC